MSADVVRSHVRNGDLVLARVAAENALASADEAERGELFALLSRIQGRLGQPREAMAAAEEAARRTDHWEARLAMGEALLAVGEPFRSRQVLTEALEGLRTSRSAFADAHAYAEAEVWLGVALADACRAAGDPSAGIAAATRASTWAEEQLGATSLEAAEALHALGMCQHAAGQDVPAGVTLRKALDVRRARIPDHPDVAASLDALGVVARARGRAEEAVRLHREALGVWVRALGEDAGPVGACRHALAQALHRTGDFRGAREEMALAVVVTGRTFGKEHVDTHIARFELGRFELDCGEVEEGIRRMEEARAAVIAKLGRDHPVVKAMNRWL